MATTARRSERSNKYQGSYIHKPSIGSASKDKGVIPSGDASADGGGGGGKRPRKDDARRAHERDVRAPLITLCMSMQSSSWFGLIANCLGCSGRHLEQAAASYPPAYEKRLAAH